MSAETVRDAILAVISSIAPETDGHELKPDVPLRQQIELDSMDWLNFCEQLRTRLAFAIDEADIGPSATLDSLIAAVQKTRQLQAGAQAVPTAPSPGALPHTRHVIRGKTVTVRPIRADDMPLEADFVRHLSAEARYKRFLVTVRELPAAKLHDLTDVDQVHHVALVAIDEREGSAVELGVARYIVDPAGRTCEFAIAVDDEWQGSGLAGILMHALIDVARARGLAAMEGFVLATNARMLKFARQLGFRSERDPQERDTVRVVLAL